MNYRLSKIRMHSAYTIEEIMSLLDVTRKTLSRWIANGLTPLHETKRPLLIMGADLKSFLRAQKLKGKVSLQKHEFFCLKCKGAVSAKKGTLGTAKTGKKIGKNNRDQLTRTGRCRFCNSKLTRFI